MNQFSHIQQLDIFLKFLSTDRGYADLKYILSRLEKDKKFQIQFDGDNAIRILNKLIKDGYVEFEDIPISRDNIFTNQPETLRKYWISFEGKFFIENSGYEGLFQAEVLKKQKDEAEIRRRIRNDRLVVLGTWAVALGAIALVLWEMYKTFVLVKH